MRRLINWIAKKLGYQRNVDILDMEIIVRDASSDDYFYATKITVSSLIESHNKYQHKLRIEKGGWWKSAIVDAADKGKTAHVRHALEKERKALSDALDTAKREMAIQMIQQWKWEDIPWDVRDWIEETFDTEGD